MDDNTYSALDERVRIARRLHALKTKIKARTDVTPSWRDGAIAAVSEMMDYVRDREPGTKNGTPPPKQKRRLGEVIKAVKATRD